jgi:hypothetical protein
MILALLGLLAAQETLDLGDRKAVVRKVDALPFVESDYTKRFTFDTADNPKLRELREKEKLDEVVAPGKDEFDRQVLLLDWAHRRFKSFGRPSSKARGALDVLKAVDEGHTFFCAHYADVFVSAAASLGWVDRALALRRHKDYPGAGSPEHTSTEIWSNQHRKWVMLDPTGNLYVEKDGVPLNAWEIRTEWFQREGKDLVFSIGKERKKHRKADLPIFLGRFAGFGDLTVPANEMEKYGFTAYIPNTNLMDAGPDYGKMFIVKDALCEAKWHERTVPANPAIDCYFPIGQAAVSLSAEGGAVKVAFRTMTPNFKEYRVRIDGGGWTPSSDAYLWKVRAGANRLEARTVNRFGVEGPVSTVEIEGSR